MSKHREIIKRHMDNMMGELDLHMPNQSGGAPDLHMPNQSGGPAGEEGAAHEASESAAVESAEPKHEENSAPKHMPSKAPKVKKTLKGLREKASKMSY